MQTGQPQNELHQAFALVSEPILLLSTEFSIQFANPAWCDWARCQADEVVGMSLSALLEQDESTPSQAAKAQYHSLCREFGSKIATDLYWRGQSLPGCDVQLDPLRTSDNQISCYVLRVFVRNTQQSVGELQQMAYRDPLTGLANRALFDKLLERELHQAQRHQGRFALLFVDLDRFKQVNDLHGHDAGDHLLCTLAERLQKVLRKSDVVARFGGDEFVVIINQVEDSDTLANVAEKIIRVLSKPVTLGANSLQAGASVGISLYPQNGETADQLMHHADAAMYRAKGQGGQSYCYFSDALNKELRDNRALEQAMRNGVDNQQFIPYFQPLFDLRNGSLCGIECLARWQLEDNEVQLPLEFLPTALKSGMISDILEQVLDKAFFHLCKWRQQYQVEVPLSVNISSKQFYQQDTIAHVQRLLAKHQLQPNDIRLELTESALQEHGDNLSKQIDTAADVGLAVNLDDYGTGYSSVKSLQNLPLKQLKIDSSFVRNIDNNPLDRIVVQAMIQLSRTLNIEVVAEGVETDTQKHFLQQNDCYIMQGFLFSHPLSAEAFEQYLQRG